MHYPSYESLDLPLHLLQNQNLSCQVLNAVTAACIRCYCNSLDKGLLVPIPTLPLSLVTVTLSLPIVTSLDTVADDGSANDPIIILLEPVVNGVI
jgi:hypothetical protein